MNIKLFNDNGCETLTPVGQMWSEMVAEALKPIVQRAVIQNVSLRDLATIVVDEISIYTAEERIRRGIDESRAAQKALKAKHVNAVSQVIN